MKEFEFASQDLIDVLEKNGFDDITAKYDQKHADRLKEGGYKPNSVKRYFALPCHDYTFFHFDYINISLLTKKVLSVFHWKPLSTDQLRGVMVFCHLPNTDQSKLHKERFKVLEIPDVITKMKSGKYPWLYKAVNRRILDNWDKIKV